MIAKLTGRVDTLGVDHAIIDVGGVGYLVSASGRTLGRLTVGATVALLVETHLREDRLQLFAFSEAGERDWFRILTGVQGVGPRVALGILTVLSPEDVIRALAAQDRAALTRADGVGPKLATRILTELKDKAAGYSLGTGAGPPGTAPGSAPAPGAAGSTALVDALSALVNLGYGRTEAFAAVTTAGRTLGEGAPVSDLIRLSLRSLGPGNLGPGNLGAGGGT